MSTAETLRVAAAGDLHAHAPGAFREFFTTVSSAADVLALCGDLTNLGTAAEAEILAADLTFCTVPVVGVLGNHDYHSGAAEEIRKILTAAKVIFLDREQFEYRGVG